MGKRGLCVCVNGMHKYIYGSVQLQGACVSG